MKVRYSYLPQQFGDCEDLWKELREFVPTGDFTLGKPLTKFEQTVHNGEPPQFTTMVIHRNGNLPQQ